MSVVGVYRWALEHEFERWKKGVGCWRWQIDDRRPEPDYIRQYFEGKPRLYPQDDPNIDLPPNVIKDAAAKKKFNFRSNRKGYTSRFLKGKSS